MLPQTYYWVFSLEIVVITFNYTNYTFLQTDVSFLVWKTSQVPTENIVILLFLTPQQ